MLCAAYSRPQEEIRYSILWYNIKLKRSSNNLWQQKKVVRPEQRKQQRVVQRVARRALQRARRDRRVQRARRARKAQRVPRAKSSSTGQRATSTFHRRTQQTWPLEVILKERRMLPPKRAVPFSCVLSHEFIILEVGILELSWDSNSKTNPGRRLGSER